MHAADGFAAADAHVSLLKMIKKIVLFIRVIAWPIFGTPEEMKEDVPWKRGALEVLIGLAIGLIIVAIIAISI